MDVAENPDSYLMSIVTSYYWAAMDMNQPYSFFVVDWEVENTVLAYAEDAEGRMGSLARRLICATAAEKSDISELETLVNSLNAESGKTAYNAAPVAKSASSEPCVILRKKISSGDEMPILSQQTVSPRRTLKAGNVILLDYIPSLWM